MKDIPPINKHTLRITNSDLFILTFNLLFSFLEIYINLEIYGLVLYNLN